MKQRPTKAMLLARTDGTAMRGISQGFFFLILWFILAVALINAAAQTNDKSSQTQSSGTVSAGDIGPAADSIRPYSPAGRDPFRRFVPPKVSSSTAKGQAAKAKLLGFPALTVRRAEFQQRVEEARRLDRPDPDPVTQYLVNELDVTGIFRDGQGFGAFVRAQPTGTTFYVRNGTRCYNGEVLRIENDDAEGDGSRVLFREITRMEVNGKQSQQERVLAKTPVRAGGKK